MADESFDVIITDQEYKQLKLQRQTNVELTLKLTNIQAKLDKSEAREQQLQQQLSHKDLEIRYLVDLILGVASESEQRAEADLQALNSGMFEVLGQSVLEPQKAEQYRKHSLCAGFAKKHALVVKKATALEERLESQQALISRLNNLQCEKNEALVHHQAAILAEAESKVKMSQAKRNELESIIKALKEEIVTLNKDITDLMLREKATEASSQQMKKQLKREVHRLKAQNETLTQKLRNLMERLKQFEMENAVLRQGLGSSFPKEETRDHIRRLIEEYAREVERSLRSIEGLSTHEINDLMQSEMKQLVDCIPKTALGRK